MGEEKTRHRSVSATKIFKMMVMALFVLFAAAAFVYVIGNMFNVPIEMPRVSYGSLDSVGNLRFEDGKFVWSSVRNATCYVVEAEGVKFTVNANEWSPQGDVSDLRVKAVDTTGRYGASDWSYFDATTPD